MAIPENQLEIWAKQGAIATSKTTYDQIKEVLNSNNSPYHKKNFEIFLQGFYKNHTNIYRESDVDIVIQLSSFQYNLDVLSLKEKTAFHETFRNSTVYGISHFKHDVFSHLQARFPRHIESGEKAIKILPEGNRRSVDIIVCSSFRYTPGICFKGSSGNRIINYPKLHSNNMTLKHQITRNWLKPIVRIFKNMRNKMIANGLIDDSDVPSYFIECILWNVPNDNFGTSYRETIRNCLVWLNTANKSMLMCANRQYKLLDPNLPITWRTDKYNKFINATIKFWNDWQVIKIG
jgi:hypothetical protein